MTRLRTLLAVALALLLGFGVAACGSDSDSDSSNASEIEGVTWKVMNVASDQGWATSIPPQVDAPTVEFADGKADVFAGCNSGSGEVEITDTTIDFSQITLGKDSCDQTERQIEFLSEKVLTGEATYELNADGNLVLENGGTSLVFTKD